MLVEIAVLAAILGVVVTRLAIRRHRRRVAEPMYVPTYPLIELEQPYGGWDADASDSYTGHGAPLIPLLPRVGPPSRWGRMP